MSEWAPQPRPEPPRRLPASVGTRAGEGSAECPGYSTSCWQPGSMIWWTGQGSSGCTEVGKEITPWVLWTPALPCQIVKVGGETQQPTMSGWLKTQKTQKWRFGPQPPSKEPPTAGVWLRVGEIENERWKDEAVHDTEPHDHDCRNKVVRTLYIFYYCVIGMCVSLYANRCLFLSSYYFTHDCWRLSLNFSLEGLEYSVTLWLNFRGDVYMISQYIDSLTSETMHPLILKSENLFVRSMAVSMSGNIKLLLLFFKLFVVYQITMCRQCGRWIMEGRDCAVFNWFLLVLNAPNFACTMERNLSFLIIFLSHMKWKC